MVKWLLTAQLFLYITSTAGASPLPNVPFFKSGQQIYNLCADGPSQNVSQCGFYVQGAVDAYVASAAMVHDTTVCMPDGVQVIQLIHLVVGELDHDPQLLNAPAAVAVGWMMHHSFPCQN